MKRLFFVLLCLVSVYASEQEDIFNKIEKELDSIIVKDLNTNELIYKKNELKHIRPASLTKIMTSMLAIESGKMNEVVTITKPMTNVIPTKLGLQVGEKLYLRDLVSVALVKSANDAAYAIGYFLGDGDLSRFLVMMNKKAKLIGMLDTTFTNPAGFDTQSHHSTAHDLLLLTEYAIQNETFNKIVDKNSYAFTTLNTKRSFKVYTSNKLKKDDKYVVGVKTGYTNGAGPCLIARAKKDDKDVLLVMLNATKNRWENARKALDEVMLIPPQRVALADEHKMGKRVRSK
jgi:D-alanyl-D-alanine carboxypeptidase (penicillin-binding protein 5/6)